MKKLLSLLLVLAMLLGCGAFAETAADYVGTWVMTNVELSGVRMIPSMMGVSASMELYESGKCVMVMVNDMQYGTWAVTETGITTTDANGVTDPFTLVDGMLEFEMDDKKLIFTKQTYAAPRSGLTVADFNGDWTFRYAQAMGQNVDAAAAGLTMRIVIKDGAGHIDITDANGLTSRDAVCEVEEVEELGTVMYFLYLDEAGAKTEYGIMLMLYDDGELVWYHNGQDGQVYYCFAPTQAAAE